MGTHLDAAMAIAHQAGELLMSFYGRVGFELKGEWDLVTEADKRTEELIVRELHARFPGHAIVAEEGGGADHDSAEYRWYVDPLDGTTNFAHGFPVFNTTLAVERNGEMIAGVVYDPLRHEMFAAERGSGARLNGEPIRVSGAPRLEDALLATGFPSWKRHLSLNVHFFHQAAMASHGVRRAGSAAIDLAYVACGRLDGFWEFGLNPWDMAAGLLLVEEAGGRISDMKGGLGTVRSPHMVASNGRIHDEMIQLFGEVYANKYRVPLPMITAE